MLNESMKKDMILTITNLCGKSCVAKFTSVNQVDKLFCIFVDPKGYEQQENK